MGPVIVILILVAGIYLLLIRPQQRRSRSHSAMQSSIAVGDEVITAGGLHGVVEEASESELRLEIAPEVVVTVDRRAVAAVAVQEPAEPDEDEDDEAEEAEGAENGENPEGEPAAVHTESERKPDSGAS